MNRAIATEVVRRNEFKSLFVEIMTAHRSSFETPYFTCTRSCRRTSKRLSAVACDELENALNEAIPLDIPTTSLYQLQDICIESMRTLFDLWESEPITEGSSSMFVDVLSSIRLALLTIPLKTEALRLQSEANLRLSLEILSKILFEIPDTVLLTSFRKMLHAASRALKAFSKVVTSVGLDIILLDLGTLVLRIFHPSSREALRHTLEASAVELISTIFLHYPQGRSELISAIIQVSMTDASESLPRQIKTNTRQSRHASSILFTNFIHLCTLSYQTVQPRDSDTTSDQAVYSDFYTQNMIFPRNRSQQVRDCLDAASKCARQIILSLSTIDQSSRYNRPTLQILCDDLVHLVLEPKGAGAELLLRQLLQCQLDVIKHNQNQLCTSLSALDLLGTMGIAVAKFYALVQETATSDQTNDIHGLSGAYRTTMEHFRSNQGQNDLQGSAAHAYLVATFAHRALYDASLTTQSDLPQQVCVKQIQTAYLITLLFTEFFQGLEQIISVLREGLEFQSSIVRLKSWKGLLGICDHNPRILDQTQGVVARCLEDPSNRVREGALISLCENRAWMSSLLQNASKGVVDKSPAIRRLFVKVFEKSYRLQDQSTIMAACYLLRAVVDDNVRVSTAAQKALEKSWLPSDTLEKDSECIVYTLALIVELYPSLESSLRHFILLNRKPSESGKWKLLIATALRKATKIVAGESAISTLGVLTVFARANGNLFRTPPYSLIDSYLTQSTMKASKTSFEQVVSILIEVVKCDRGFDGKSLAQLRSTLLNLLTMCKDDTSTDCVTKCLCTVSEKLNSGPRISTIIKSLERQIGRLDEKDSQNIAKIGRLIRLVGYIGKNILVKDHKTSVIRQSCHWEPRSIIELLLRIFKRQSGSLSHLALQSICRFCHSWPSYLIDDELSCVFSEVLRGNDDVSQIAVTAALLECLLSREKDIIPNVDDKTLANIEWSVRDKVAYQSTELHLPSILLLAMKGQTRRTLIITRYIVAVSTQGLVCPSRVYSTLVALGTSQDSKVAHIASNEHMRLHRRGQSALKLCYVEAIQKSYLYQQRIEGNTTGATKSSFRAKLSEMFRAINSCSKRSRNDFFTRMGSELNFQIRDPNNVMYVRYIMENWAFYALEHPEDMNTILTCLKRVLEVQSSEIETHQNGTNRAAAMAIIGHVHCFLRDESNVTNQSKDFARAIIKHHRDQGSLLLESIETSLNVTRSVD